MRYSIIPRETKLATVKAVHDGDSIKVKFEDGEVVWIRLHGCDAPEVVSNHVSASQPYGKEAGDYLRKLVKGNQVEVETLFLDQYNRMICKVKLVNPLDRNLDVDLTWLLISAGNAWWLSEPKQTKEERELMKGWHEAAQEANVGLWAQPGRKLRPSTWRGRNHNPAGITFDEDLW